MRSKKIMFLASLVFELGASCISGKQGAEKFLGEGGEVDCLCRIQHFIVGIQI
jgi:hypothetical protein